MGGRIESGPHIGRWVAGKIKGVYHEGDAAIGLVKDGKIIAGVLYENWNGRSIMAHMGIEGRLTPAFIGAVFDYAYNVCNVDKVILPIGSMNAKSIKLVENMGFAEEGRIADASPEGDIVIYTLKKADCRFLGDRYGKKFSTAPARSA
jgi:RimJ/RimL family protein N-acetyltransferase